MCPLFHPPTSSAPHFPIICPINVPTVRAVDTQAAKAGRQAPPTRPHAAEISRRTRERTRDKNKNTKRDGGTEAAPGRRVSPVWLYHGAPGIFTFVLCGLYERNTFLQSILDSLRLRQILSSPPVRAGVHAALRARGYGGFGGMLGQANCAFGVRPGPSERD